MATRVTQQLLFVGYTTTPAVRCTAVALEVVRTVAASALTASNAQPVIFIMT